MDSARFCMHLWAFCQKFILGFCSVGSAGLCRIWVNSAANLKLGQVFGCKDTATRNFSSTAFHTDDLLQQIFVSCESKVRVMVRVWVRVKVWDMVMIRVRVAVRL